MGEDLRFYLSHGLFSSFAADPGTKLLLKTLAQQNAVPKNGRIFDAGCGTGIIAVSLKKKFPDADITAVDRDALALYFTSKNAVHNGIGEQGFKVTAGLLPGSLKIPAGTAPQKYDLIVSNIPAKAGNPVIADFLRNCGLHLTADGFAAVVIVAPLAAFAEECLNLAGAEIRYREEDRQYSVFHFKPPVNETVRTFPEIYERSKVDISGVYGLPEFDSISYSTKLILEVLRGYSCGGKTLIWNPGIGHLPAACSSAAELTIAGNDLLQLKACDYNSTAGSVHYHLPFFSALEQSAVTKQNYIIAVPDFVSGAGAEHGIISTAGKLLEPGGKLLVAGKSSDMARLEKSRKDFSVKHSIKYRGFRVILLQQPGSRR